MEKKNISIETRIKKALEKVRPGLQMDGGDVQFVSWNEKTGVVAVALQGMCMHCPMAKITLKEGVEKTVREEVPEVKEVVGV